MRSYRSRTMPGSQRPSIRYYAPRKPVRADFKALLDAANEAARREAAQWLIFLTLLIYIALAVSTTTHRMLFLEEPLVLPLLNVKVPLSSFYSLAPVLLVVLHFYEFVQLRAMVDKIEAAADLALEEAVGDIGALRGALLRLDSFPIAQLILARYLGEARLPLRIMAAATLLLAPLGLLIWMEVQFLPFHSAPTLAWHLTLIAIDVAIIVSLGIRRGEIAATGVDVWRLLGWPFRVWWRSRQQPGFRHWRDVWDFAGVRWLHPRAVWSAYTRAVWTLHPAQRRVRRLTKVALLAVFVFQCVSVSAISLLSLDGFDTENWPALVLNYEDFASEVGQSPGSAGHPLMLRRRDFRNASFVEANLRRVDFSESDLRGARLYRAAMQGATLQHAKLDDVLAEGAQLQGADLDGASLRSADLQYTNLQGARLTRTCALGVVLHGAQLQGAQIGGGNATLVGADLSDASLQGADFQSVNLSGASFSGAMLQGAAFGTGALEVVRMSGAQFDRASVWNATIVHAADLTPQQVASTFGPMVAGALDTSDAPPAPFNSAHPTWNDWITSWVDDIPREDLRSQARMRLLRLKGVDVRPSRSGLFDPTPLIDLLVRIQPPPAGVVRDNLLELACDERFGPDVPLGIRANGKRRFGRNFDRQLLDRFEAGTCPSASDLRKNLNVINSIL